MILVFFAMGLVVVSTSLMRMRAAEGQRGRKRTVAVGMVGSGTGSDSKEQRCSPNTNRPSFVAGVTQMAKWRAIVSSVLSF